MRKLFNNPPLAILGIVLVILLFVSYKAKATELEIGPTYTSGFNGGVGLSVIERVADGKIDLGVTLLGEQSWENVNVSNNGNVWAAYVAEKPETWVAALPSEVHIGATYWFKAESPISGCQNGYLLGLKWRLGEQFSVGIRHWSNAGTCPPNRGQDLLTFGWRF